MKTPKDIIADVLRERGAADADKTAGEIIFSLARDGYSLTRRKAALPVQPRASRRIDPAEQEQLIEEIEATTAQRTKDWIREMRKARHGLR